MIEIDGSILEGGGQILRTAVAISALTRTPVRVTKIRANRGNPGLQAQHLAAVEATALLADAKVVGLSIGSPTIEFHPQTIKGGVFKIDVGTAGSISLVLQALAPVACFAPSEVTLELTGGTDVRWSPTFDFLNLVFLPTLRKMGCEISAELVKRGHYPKGGGLVNVSFRPICGKLRAIKLDEFGKVESIKGISHAVKLPKHVAIRQAEAAKEALSRAGFPNPELEIWYRESEIRHLGPGSGIALCARTNTSALIGADALGEKGKAAEKVGSEAAEKLVSYLRKGCVVDPNLSDMLVPYMALASGTSVLATSHLTLHSQTNMAITRKFIEASFEVGRRDTLTVISCVGQGY